MNSTLGAPFQSINANQFDPSEAAKYRDGLKYEECSQFGRERELTKLNEDVCERRVRNAERTKPMKYWTRDFHNWGPNPSMACFVGTFPHDGPSTGQAPSTDLIDVHSQFRSGVQLPRCKGRQQLETLPLHRGFEFGSVGDPYVEVDLKAGYYQTPAKSCQPKGDEFYKRSFYHFDHDPSCFDHQAVDRVVLPSVVKSDVAGVVGNRLGGLDSRQDKQETNVIGKGCADSVFRNTPPHLFN